MTRRALPGKLPAAAVRNAKPKDKPYKLSDGGGLYLLVSPQGGKYWRLKYRLHGVERTLALGVFPAVSMAEARREVEAAKELIRKGVDPVRARVHVRATKAGNTFEVVAREWHEKQKGRWSADHADRVLDSLETDVFPRIGSTPIQDIKALDCLAVVKAVEDRGALDTAGRVKQRMSSVFRYAIQTARLEINPADQLKEVIATKKVEHRASLPAEALPGFLRQLEAYPGQTVTKLALKLLMLTFVRPGELRAARWEEFDIEGRMWRIPAERMKMKEEHLVPLSDQALAVLEELRPLTAKFGYLSPATTNVRKPMSENTLTYAIRRRLGFNATAHGMRALASTVMNEVGFAPDVIERQLAHAERNKVRAAYNRGQYLEQRRTMMQWWGDFLDAQRDDQKIVPIRRHAHG